MNELDDAACAAWADARATDLAIAYTIFIMLADGDDEAARIWRAPTPFEAGFIAANAWSWHAAEGYDRLAWGPRFIDRPAK